MSFRCFSMLRRLISSMGVSVGAALVACMSPHLTVRGMVPPLLIRALEKYKSLARDGRGARGGVGGRARLARRREPRQPVVYREGHPEADEPRVVVERPERRDYQPDPREEAA